MHPPLLPTLHSERLTLRAMIDGDAAALLAIYGDPRVMRFTDETPFPDLATVGLMLASARRLLASGESLEWAIVLHESTSEVIGTCGLHGFEHQAAEVGCLLRHADWGKGLMAEAVHLLMGYARNTLRLQRLMANVADENERARRLFARLGFVPAGPDMLEIALHPAGDTRHDDRCGVSRQP